LTLACPVPLKSLVLPSDMPVFSIAELLVLNGRDNRSMSQVAACIMMVCEGIHLETESDTEYACRLTELLIP